MEEEFQRLLDEQWDALESRDRQVHAVRRKIANRLDLLAELCAKDAAELDEQLLAGHDYIQRERAIIAKREQLQAQLAIEMKSDLHKSIVTLSEQVSTLDEQIEELQTRRHKLSQEAEDLRSIFSSRTAKIHDHLADLEASHPQDNQKMVENVQKRVNDQEKQQRTFNRESVAAKQGLKLWNQVCVELDKLDSDLKGLKRDQMPQMAFLLDQTALKVHESLDFAEDNGWSVLTIAIGHELQILNETKAAVKRAS